MTSTPHLPPAAHQSARARSAAAVPPSHWAAPRRALCGLTAVALSLACADATGPEEGECGVVTRRGVAVVTPSLSPGDMCAVPVDNILSMEIGPGTAPAQYLLAVQSGLRAPGASTRLRLSAWGRGAAAARVPALAADARPASAAALRPPSAATRRLSGQARSSSVEAGALEAASLAELTLRTSARRALRGVRPLTGRRSGSPVPLERANRTPPFDATRPPAVGDTVVFRNGVDTDLNVGCEVIHDVTTVVRAVGRHFAVAEDVEGAGVVSPDRYAGVVRSLEHYVFPVVTGYFGEPGDIDGNGVIWVVFTPVVNRATPRSSETRISGFFNPADLADPERCAASNGGEVLWLLAADPDGRYSRPVPAAFAPSRAIGVVAHELEHLISAERRTVLAGGTFADLEDVWLSEGLAHSAETFVGMWLERQRPGRNYGFDELTVDTETFGTYHFSNLRRAAYYLSRPHATPALGDDAGRDPSGIASLRMRGFAWLLLRWFADQYAVGGGGLLGGAAEEGIFRDLAGGGPGRVSGVQNLERVAASLGAPGDWEVLLASWTLAPLADDLPGSLPGSTQLTSLHLPDAYAELHRILEGGEPFSRPHPLLATEIGIAPDTDVRVEFELNAATGRYFVLESDGPHAALDIRLTKLAGGRPPASAGVRLVILRTR